jgi:dynein heavy chain
MMYVDKLNGLLSSYDAALDGLKPVEKRLLLTQLYELDLQMKKGAQDYNWFSLSIKEYITQCKKAIEKFEVTKGRVLSHASNIEKQVKAIENAEIIREIDFKTHTTKDIQDLMDYFEKFRLHALDTLVKDYQNIGDNYLKQIEFSTF